MPKRSRNRDPVKIMLMKLPEEVRHQAVANIDPTFRPYNPDPNGPRQALGTAFSWMDTSEGHSFWSKVHDKECEKETENAKKK